MSDVSVLTLYSDRMTSGRRSSPVPHLKCVGGTAKGYLSPALVQCYNRGSDGNDIQWECKTDMDNAFRFGSVEVTCEGYGYPEDPYILKGSCGLEYTLELTEEGRERYKQQKSHSYGGDSHSSHYDFGSVGKKSKSMEGDLLFLGGIAVVMYVIYRSGIAPSAATPNDGTDGNRGQANRGDNPPPYSPPTYGEEYMPGNDDYSGSSTGSAGCQGSGAYTGPHTNTANNQGGGFWSGAATGGFLGYLFGRNTGYGGGYTQYQQPHYGGNRGWNTGRSNGWFSGLGSSSGGARTSYGGSSSFGGGGGSSAPASSGTRTASGFGGTRRR
ncbi:hypothetical protein ACOMHN_013508 [Nucella lapillus]